MNTRLQDWLLQQRIAFYQWLARYHRTLAMEHQFDAKAADAKASKALCDWAIN